MDHYYLGKTVDDCTKEELIRCIEIMGASDVKWKSALEISLQEENERLKEENKKLWKAISN